MSEPVAGVLLAGGLSRRMGGGDKALAALAGKPLISHAAVCLAPQVRALVVNANGDPKRFESLGLPIVPDQTSDFAGPLSGILAGLRWAERDGRGTGGLVSVPADAPFIPSDLVARLYEAHRMVGPDRPAVARSRGRRHHVIALWPASAAAAIADALRRDARKVENLVDALDAVTVTFPDRVIGGESIDPFFNVNTPDDLLAAERLLASEPAAPRPFVFGVAGWKNSGKTTLVERLVATLVARGCDVATVKHSHHALEGEHTGSDSDRHRRAGASAVALTGRNGWMLIDSTGHAHWREGQAPPLGDIVEQLGSVDIVIVEGLKSAPIPKIEVRRTGQGDGPPLAADDRTVFAVAADHPAAADGIPVFSLDDIEQLADAALLKRDASRTRKSRAK